MTFRVDFDYLRGLLHLLGEVQNLNLTPTPLDSRDSPTTDSADSSHSTKPSAADSHEESKKSGIGIVNLSGIPLRVRLSQFFFTNPATSQTSESDERAGSASSKKRCSEQHTTEWCRIPALNEEVLVGSVQGKNVVHVPGASR